MSSPDPNLLNSAETAITFADMALRGFELWGDCVQTGQGFRMMETAFASYREARNQMRASCDDLVEKNRRLQIENEQMRVVLMEVSSLIKSIAKDL